MRARLTAGEHLDPRAAQAGVSPESLNRPPPDGENIAILVPLRDAAQHVASFLSAIEKLDLPTEQVKLVFCEGDSRDDTFEVLTRLVEPLRGRYRDVIVLRKDLGTRMEREHRARRSLQRARRAGIAAVRNHLIDHGLDETDDWALWIDVDVWRFASDIVHQLRAAQARIVVPNCVTVPGGDSFDRNSFLSRPLLREYHYEYYSAIQDGLFQPRPDRSRLFRFHLSDLRHSERVTLNGVGGTMLLVDAALHRGGLRFPELPYKQLIETEGFGQLACDLGIQPIGLPRVEILHVPW
ncbi:hypothetical protein [Terrihabitans sp. B22-R8]|uniref:hypothetical protein n=1 Tax=Terrihabitans sp. B22-R8 TaxID=3425128 RepID=UPI00403CC769